MRSIRHPLRSNLIGPDHEGHTRFVGNLRQARQVVLADRLGNASHVWRGPVLPGQVAFWKHQKRHTCRLGLGSRAPNLIDDFG